MVKIALRLLLTLALVLGTAGPAAATPDTLRRSVSNILMAPLDLGLSPVVGTKAVVTNLREIDDTPAVRVAFVLPGIIWNTGIQLGGGAMRLFTGLVELLPGLGLYFMEADLDPLFDPVEKADALVDIETPPMWVKFGVDYVD